MAENIKYISKIKLSNDNDDTIEVYNIKDLEAQTILNTLLNEELIIDCGGVPQ